MAESVEEIDKRLSKQYSIKRPIYNESHLKEVRVLLDEKLRENSSWEKIWVTEETVVRFLKAFLHVHETVHALEEYCKWRLEENIDGIAASDVEADEKMKKEQARKRDRILHGHYDRCGRPIMLATVRNHDKHHNDYPTLFRYSVYCLENLIQIADQRTFDRRICLIFDLGGFGTANMDFKFVKQTLHVLRDFYPERIGTCFIINYPWIFWGCWKIIKVWMNEVTRSKFIFAGEKELSDFIELEKFPVTLFHTR